MKREEESNGKGGVTCRARGAFFSCIKLFQRQGNCSIRCTWQQTYCSCLYQYINIICNFIYYKSGIEKNFSDNLSRKKIIMGYWKEIAIEMQEEQRDKHLATT